MSTATNKERAKLAANVSKMIGALKAKAGVSPDTAALGISSSSNNNNNNNRSTSTGSSAFRTPSRDRHSSPGANSLSSDDNYAFDAKSFNRSSRGGSIGDNASQASLLDIPDENVFNQGGFGLNSQSNGVNSQRPSARGVDNGPDKAKPVKPQPRRDAPSGATTGGARDNAERRTSDSERTRSSRREGGDRTPHRRRDETRSSNQQQPPRATPPNAPISSSDHSRPTNTKTTPLSSRSETPQTHAIEERRKNPKPEERYAVDATREAEPSRKQQLQEGSRGDARRSAPRRHDSPADGNRDSEGRSRSTQRRMQEAARRAAGQRSEGEREGREKRHAPPAQGDYQLPQAIRQSPPQPTPTSSKVPSKESTPVTAALSTSAAAAVSSTNEQRVGSPGVGIRRKQAPSSNNTSVTSSKQLSQSQQPQGASAVGVSETPRAAASPQHHHHAASTGGAFGVTTGVAKAIATMSSNTTRALLGKSGESPRQSPRANRTGGVSPQQKAFSLADFVRETSSQYDFNRAPSRMSNGGGSQFGGSDGGNSGVSTPVRIRGATLLDSISEHKFPAKPLPTATAGVVDSTWLDGTSKQTTTGGLEKTERSVRFRIQHAALFRPRVWFINNILPLMRQMMLKDFASRKRKMFVECAEPNFRLDITAQCQSEMTRIRCMREEDIDRMDLERATLLWRMQVKTAFDRLVQQLRVEVQRSQEAVRHSVETEIAKGANALAEKTSFSYLHLHQQFAEGLLRRTKELYIYYFGIMASMNIKEEKERGSIASEQRFARLVIELDRIRFFIQHLELVEYENILKYFAGEKRILESELRFKPSASSRSASPLTMMRADRSAQGGAAAGQSLTSALRSTSSVGGPVSSTTASVSATPLPWQHQSDGRATPAFAPSAQPSGTTYSRGDIVTPTPNFKEHRKETQSPFPLDALERQQQFRRSQQSELQERELQAFRTPSVSVAARNPQESFLPSHRQVEQPVAAQHRYPESYQQTNPLANLQALQQAQHLERQQAALERMPPPATSSATLPFTVSRSTDRSSSSSNAAVDTPSRKAQQLQYEEANFSSTLPAIGGRRSQQALGVEDKRRSDDEEDLPLPAAPIRGGHLLPKIDPAVRKARESTEGVVNGLMLVSRVMGETNLGGGASSSSATATTPTSASAMGGRLLPPISKAPTAALSSTSTVATLGRMLLGSSAVPSEVTEADVYGVPDAAIDDRRVAQAEVDTAVALLLLLHKNGADVISNDEGSVRKSLLFYEQENKKEAVTRTAASRTDRFFRTRLEKLGVEEQELRFELTQAQRHEFGLHIQRLQWVEYFLLTTDEASERERIVGMSHLSKAIIAKNNKQEFSVTCLMQHQVAALHQWHLFQRWFVSDVEYPTSLGLAVSQCERRERNKLSMQMEKESRLLSQDARERRAVRSLYSSQSGASSINTVEFEALASVEEVHRRNIARSYAEFFQRFIFESWEEPMHRGVIAIARERWFRDLVRPSQHRITIHISESKGREGVALQEAADRLALKRTSLFSSYEAMYQDLCATEQREFRRLSLACLKERRQREARERDSTAKKEQTQRYLQNAIVASVNNVASMSPSKHPVLGEALNRYMAATAAEAAQGIRSASQTPIPDYSVMMRAKQHSHAAQNAMH